MTSYQKLADGTTIEKQSTASLARDSQGRTWSKVKRPGDPLRPETMRYETISVFDPNTRTSTNWCTCSKVATVKHFGEPLPRRTERVPGAEGMDVYLGPDREHRLKYHTEELPPQIIMGVTTRGSKVVRIVPAGVDGNDKDLTTTIQSWYSPELRLALITIIDDPVSGLRKFEFSNMKRTEPDPALFQVPAGYTLRDEENRTAAR
ncbi:MAG: hypothetical protein PW789_11610 [Edaphobacter sp.]|uniref:hypothetical protein n=1 Tax=Edaphobacter sp. TaxID=1934404 RepID=UPI0023942CF2|nr:hypothetical protein [Edaphobacter sp.]MDE1177232.1 hypothetical protein [Edaphobacter sp.]